MTKYEKWYNNLIEKAKSRNWTRDSAPEYVELHHIIPKSLGGSNDSSNLVFLTAKEHCVAHQLLCRYGDTNQRIKMTHAMHRFLITNKTVSKALRNSTRKRIAEVCSIKSKGSNNPCYGLKGKNHPTALAKKQLHENVLEFYKTRPDLKFGYVTKNGKILTYERAFSKHFCKKYNMTDVALYNIITNSTWMG